MGRSDVTMIDLPDEMILHICCKMKNIDVLYAFIGLNQRFNQLAHDRHFTRSIELIERNVDQTIRPLPDLILDRFYGHILPAIHSLVESLTVESSTMERSLFIGDYRSLTILTLLHVDENFAARHFTSKKISIGRDTNRSAYFRFRKLTIHASVQETDHVAEDHGRRSWSTRIDGWYDHEYLCSDLFSLHLLSGFGFQRAWLELVLCTISTSWCFFKDLLFILNSQFTTRSRILEWLPLSTRRSSTSITKTGCWNIPDRSLRCRCGS